MNDDRTVHTHDYTRKNVEREDRSFSWLPLLLLPLFFFLGWAANDYTNPVSDDLGTGTPTYGVGGGPANPTLSPTFSPSPSASATATPLDVESNTDSTGI